MITQCPTCGRVHDVPDRDVVAHAARIMQRHSRKGTEAQVEASRRNGSKGGRPRTITEIVRDATRGMK